jgi:tRNA-U16,U17-dihydrouridine synthase
MSVTPIDSVAAPPADHLSPWRFCVAPMMDWTDRRCRRFHRQLSRRARLYTEMIHATAVIHGDRKRLLAFDPEEQPLALQLGGNDPAQLAQAARIGADWGYDEINLNCGCPSDRVREGHFGACLMLDPERVAEGVAAMRAAVDVPVTVKCRVGVDLHDDEAFLHRFVGAVVAAGCDALIVHARKAWLSGLSPKENREIPPLQPDRVQRLKLAFPQLPIIINGGIADLAAAAPHLRWADGVMLGRAAYQDPWLLARVDSTLFGEPDPLHERTQALLALRAVVERDLAAGVRLAAHSRHWLGLFRSEPGGRAFRRVLSERAHRRDADWTVVERALIAADELYDAA